MSNFLTNKQYIYDTFLSGSSSLTLDYYKKGTPNLTLTNKKYYMYGTRKRSFFQQNGVDIGSLFQYDAVTYVNVLGGSYNIYPWGTNNTLFQNARWIWTTAHANISSPGADNGIFYWYYYSFYYSGQSNTGKIHGICDNTALMFFNNGSAIASGSWNQGANGVTTNADISIVKGLNYIRVAAYNAGSGTTDVNGLIFRLYTGYFGDTVGTADTLTFFDTATLQKSGTGIIIFTNIKTATNDYVPLDFSKDLYSVIWYGIFYSDYTGTWTFSLNSDDASYMWIGPNADSGYTTSNANIRNPGLHGMNTVSCTVDLFSGQYYPIRIVFGENYGGDNCIFTCANPNLTATSDFTGRFFAPSTNASGLMVTVYDSGGINIANTNTEWVYSTIVSPYNTTSNYNNSAGALVFNQNAT